jgi:hypothetical protein
MFMLISSCRHLSLQITRQAANIHAKLVTYTIFNIAIPLVAVLVIQIRMFWASRIRHYFVRIRIWIQILP